MGIASSAAFVLPPPLHSIGRRLLRLLHPERAPAHTAGAPLWGAFSEACSTDGRPRPDFAGTRPAAGASTLAPRSLAPRPARSRWPFIVRPVPSEPCASPAREAANAPVEPARALSPGHGHAGAAPAALTVVPTPARRRAPPAVRKACDARTGRLVLSGRIADVCAELDRLAAMETLAQRAA